MKASGILKAVFGHRAGFAAAVFALCAAAVFIASRTPTTTDIFDILPTRDPVIAAHLRASAAFKTGDSLCFSVSNNSENSARAADKLAEELEKCDGFEKITGNLAKDAAAYSALVKYLPSIFGVPSGAAEKLSAKMLAERFADAKRRAASGDFAAVKSLKADPLNTAALYSKALEKDLIFDGAKTQNFRIISADGGALLVKADGSFPCSDSAASAELVEKVEAILARLKAEFPDVQIRWTGGYRLSAENAAIAAGESRNALFATVAAIFAICALSLADFKLSLAAAAPSAVGSAVAFAAVALVFGEISSISVAFAGLAVGASVDYAVHALWRAQKGGVYALEEAQRTVEYAAKPIFAAAGTSAAAFAILGVCGADGFAQTGVFGVVGIFVAAAASVCVLPAYFVGYAPKHKGVKILPKIFAAAARKISESKFCFWAAVALTFAAVAPALKTTFDGNLGAFNALGDAAKADDAAMRKTWRGALSVKSVFAEADSPEELLKTARALSDFLDSRPDAVQFGAHKLLVDGDTAAENLRKWRDFADKNRVAENAKRAARAAGLNADAVEAAAQKTLGAPQISAEKIFGELAPLFGKSAKQSGEKFALSATFTPKDGFDARRFSAELSEKFANAHLIDPDLLGARISEISRGWLAEFAAVSLAAVAAYLWLAFSAAGAAAVLLSVSAGLVWGFAAIALLGISINPISCVFVIFAVCLAQDYAVFVFNAVKNRRSPDDAFEPMSVASTTTVAAFAILALCRHPAFSALGTTAAISITAILLSSLCLTRRISNLFLGRGKDGK